MERELLLTGIGGQGVQLAAQVIARAATLEGRSVMLFGLYGGMMRGGNTDATVVVGDEPLRAPPIVSQAWSAIAMHDEYWAPTAAKLVPDAVVLANDETFTSELPDGAHVHRVPATNLATQVGSPIAGALVMAGAYASYTGLVERDALVEAMRASIPPYRRQHVEGNERAIHAGWDALPRLGAPAWEHPARSDLVADAGARP